MHRDIRNLKGKEVVVVIRTDEFVISSMEDRVGGVVTDDNGIHIIFEESQLNIDIVKDKVKNVFVLANQTQIVLTSGIKILFENCLTEPII